MQQVRDRVEQVSRQRPAEVSLQGAEALQATTLDMDVLRIGGADRYAVAAAVADHYWGQYFWNGNSGEVGFAKFAFVASGHGFPDALSGGAAAAAYGGPLLLTKPSEIPVATQRSLARLKPDVIVVLGGTATISTAVEHQLREYVQSAANVTRVTGADRYAVSANLASGIGWSDVAYVASGENFPDGMAGGAVAGYETAPLLITRPTSVPDTVLKVLKEEVTPQRIYVLGGTASVSDAVVEQLKREVTTDVRRITGADRYEVAEGLASRHPTQGLATISSGQAWPDALAGSALAGMLGSKLLLVKPDALPAPTRRAVERHGLSVIDVLGGSASVQETVLTQLRALQVSDPNQ